MKTMQKLQIAPASKRPSPDFFCYMLWQLQYLTLYYNVV
jgi:hypothetical protein